MFVVTHAIPNATHLNNTKRNAGMQDPCRFNNLQGFLRYSLSMFGLSNITLYAMAAAALAGGVFGYGAYKHHQGYEEGAGELKEAQKALSLEIGCREGSTCARKALETAIAASNQVKQAQQAAADNNEKRRHESEAKANDIARANQQKLDALSKVNTALDKRFRDALIHDASCSKWAAEIVKCPLSTDL